MDCPSCGEKGLPTKAKFCRECGASLGGAQRPGGAQVQIKQDVGKAEGGEVTGLKVGTVKGDVSVVHGNVFHLHDPSPEVVRQLGLAQEVSTEMRPARSGEPQDPATRERFARLESNVKEILERVRSADRQGERIEQVEVGGVQVSRVELLLKQAVLLKTEASQMMLDQVTRNKDAIDRAKAQGTATHFQIDLAEMVEGFDAEAHDVKLREARELLEEAHRLDGSNAEVMLHLAQVMEDLEEDPRRVQALLFKVQSLLEPPRNDTDKFHLGQAKFLSAMAGEHPHPDQLRAARDLFAQLGRSDWVEHIDLLLRSAGAAPAATAAHGTGFVPEQQQPAGFNPVGRWQVQVSDGNAYVIELQPNGALGGVRQPGMWGGLVQLGGQWGFDPVRQLLQLQGIAGFQPFMLMLQIQGQQGVVWVAGGSDGLMYELGRLS